jgi:hypothetical protein
MRATNSDTASSESGEPSGQAPPPSTVLGEDMEFVLVAGFTYMDLVYVLVPPSLLFLIATDVFGYAPNWPLFGVTLGAMLGLLAFVRVARDVRRVTPEEYAALRSPTPRPDASANESGENSSHSTQNHDTTTEED